MSTQILLIGEHSLILLTPPENVCDNCGGYVEIGDHPFCGGDPSKHVPVLAKPIFPSFEFEGHVIDSLQAATRVERQSEQAYRDGRGAPIRFRSFHQDNSNRDCNTFGPSPQAPTPKSHRNKTGFGDQAKNREVHPAVRRIRGE